MRRAPRIALAPEEEVVLERWAREERGGRRLALRSRIVLGAARGRTNAEIAADLATHPETVARWRTRFVTNGLEGVEREAPRSGDPRRVAPSVVARILEASTDLGATPAQGWSTRSLARTLNVNHMLVHRVWKAHGLVDRDAPKASGEGGARVELVGALRTPELRAVVFAVRSQGGSLADGPGGPSLGPEVRLDALVSDPRAAAQRILEAVRRLRRTRVAASSRGSSAAPLLVFLRGIERATPPATRLDIVADCRPTRLGARTLAWLEAHPRFRLYATQPRQSWSSAVASWMARWEHRPLSRESFRNARAFAAALPPAPPGRRRAVERLSWRAPPA